MEIKKYATLEDILNTDNDNLTKLDTGEYEVDKLGVIPFTAIDHAEHKQIKKDCMKMVPNGTGGMVPELDDDKLMLEVIVTAVDKDPRSNFTFANKGLLDKLGVTTANAAVGLLLKPGEIFNMAIEIQNLSGFGEKAKKEVKDAVKNS